MKGLHKVIYPFAPDQSGAVSVLYELGGLLVVVDAGGCTGNICGFDEPRWQQQKSAVFSAGLRDMDAILGRDELLVKKMAEAAEKMDLNFAALIGTPVPATIGTDYKAVARMAEKAIGLPVLALDTNGIRWYDEGAEKAYLAIFDRFTKQDGERVPRSLGILGATPLDLGSLDAPQRMRMKLQQQGWERILCYGNGGTLSQIKSAGRTEQNLVVSPSGLAAAQSLRKRFGTPYRCEYPDLNPCWETIAKDLVGKRTLIVHQQIAANTLRKKSCSTARQMSRRQPILCKSRSFRNRRTFTSAKRMTLQILSARENTIAFWRIRHSVPQSRTTEEDSMLFRTLQYPASCRARKGLRRKEWCYERGSMHPGKGLRDCPRRRVPAFCKPDCGCASAEGKRLQ